MNTKNLSKTEWRLLPKPNPRNRKNSSLENILLGEPKMVGHLDLANKRYYVFENGQIRNIPPTGHSTTEREARRQAKKERINFIKNRVQT